MLDEFVLILMLIYLMSSNIINGRRKLSLIGYCILI